MSSYKPKSLDELNSMYDKALSAQRAIKRGTSKIDETTSSESFFDDVIKEAELTVSKEPEKRIADLSVAVDDFIKHFSEPEAKKVEVPSIRNTPDKVKPKETVKTPVAKAEKKADTIIATPSPAIARKQSGEHISSLMSDYIKIMNDQDDSDDEPRHRKSFLTRKKEKKLAAKEAFKEEEKDEEAFEEPEYIPLSDEMKEEVFPSEKPEDSVVSAAGEEAFNAFSAMSKKKESFFKESSVKEEPSAEEEITEDVSAAEDNEAAEASYEEITEEVKADTEDLSETPAEDESTDTDSDDKSEEEEEAYEELSSYSDEAEEDETEENIDEEDDDEDFEDEVPSYSKGKNTLRVISRVFLSIICTVTILCSLFSASLSTVFNVNTGKEVFGKYYFFTSSHDFFASGVKAGDLVICEKRATVSDDETAVYIDLENRTFSFGVKDGSITDDNGDILYLIDDNKIDRDDVLGTVYETVPVLGDVIVLIYEYYIPVIVSLVSVSAVLLFVIIFALKKKKAEYYDEDFEEDAEEAAEETEETEEQYSAENKEADTEEDFGTDIFAELD